MRRLVSIPIAVLMSLLIASTALASFCGNESKPEGKGQFATLWVNTTTGSVLITEDGQPVDRVRGGFVDTYLDFNNDGVWDCFIDDTYFISEHKGIGEVAPGQAFGDPAHPLAVLPAIHRGGHPDGNPGHATSGAGFASFTPLTDDCV